MLAAERPPRPVLVPRLPVLARGAFTAQAGLPVPSLLESPSLHLTTSGRASILLAMRCVGVGPGSTVLLPTYHCPTMVSPVVALGGSVVFYPTDAHGAPDLGWLDTHAPPAKVLLAAHYFGLPLDMADIRRWCDGRGIALVEDCAHALFGSLHGQRLGRTGDIAIGSLTKFLPVPEGGALVINRPWLIPPALAASAARRQLSAVLDIIETSAQFDRLGPLSRPLVVTLASLRTLRRSKVSSSPPTSQNTDAGGSLHLSDEQVIANARVDVAVAGQRAARVTRWVADHANRRRIAECRRRNFAALLRGLLQHSGLRPLHEGPLPDGAVPYVFPLWVDRPDPGYARLRALGIPVSRWDWLWPGVPDLPGDHGKRWSHHVLQLACHQDLSSTDVQRVVDVVRQIYRE